MKLKELIDRLKNIAENEGDQIEVFFKDEYYDNYFSVSSVTTEDEEELCAVIEGSE